MLVLAFDLMTLYITIAYNGSWIENVKMIQDRLRRIISMRRKKPFVKF